MPLGAIVAGAASFISGILGRSSAKKQAKKEEEAIRKANDVATANAQQMNKEIRARADAAALVPVATERETRTTGGVDTGRFLKEAEEMGINPLTMVRSGALSLYADTTVNDWTCTTGERAMDAALSGTYLPQLSPVIAQTKVPGIGEIAGNALVSGANQYLSDLSQAENNAFQMALLDKKLAGVQTPGSYSGSRSGYVPQAHMTGEVTKKGDWPLFSPNTLWGKTDKIPNMQFTQLENKEPIVINDPLLGKTYIPQGEAADVYSKHAGDFWGEILNASSIFALNTRIMWENDPGVREARRIAAEVAAAAKRYQASKPYIGSRGQ